MAKTRQVSFLERVSYGLGDTASNLTFTFVNVFLMIYYTDVVGLSPVAVGTLFLVARIWDAINDPIMGIIIDKTNTKWGKSRPYFLWMAIPYGLIAIMMFSVPELSESGKLIWAYITYIAYGMVYTAINIPLSAILPSMTDDVQERQEVTSVRMTLAQIGGLIVNMGGPMLVIALGAGNAANGYQYTMILLASIAVVLFIVTFKNVRERVKPVNEKPLPISEGVKAIKGNWPWLISLLLNFVMWFSLIMKMSTTVYFLKYNLQRPELASIVLPLGSLMILTIAITPIFTKRMGKRNTMIMGNVIAILGYLLVIIAPTSIPMVMASAAISALGTGFIAGIIFALMADTVDYGEYISGVRAQGLLFAASSFGVKLGMGVGGAVVGYILAGTGYDGAAAVQSAEALNGILINYAWAPIIGAVLSIVLLYFYKLDKQLPQITAELKARREA